MIRRRPPWPRIVDVGAAAVMLTAFIGLLMLAGLGGCTSNPPETVVELKIDKAQRMCKEYTAAQMGSYRRTVDPSIGEVCSAMHKCAMDYGCRLTFPHWHYTR